MQAIRMIAAERNLHRNDGEVLDSISVIYLQRPVIMHKYLVSLLIAVLYSATDRTFSAIKFFCGSTWNIFSSEYCP
jgi:hypothetical protein